jgi:thioredoxin-related protein
MVSCAQFHCHTRGCYSFTKDPYLRLMPIMNSKRIFLKNASLFIAFYAVLTRAVAQNRPKTTLLPFPDNLGTLAGQAQRQGQPLVLMVSLPGCPWCELLRRNYLTPMRKEGLHAFEFMIHEQRMQLVDFQAQRVTPSALSERLKVTITPSLLFFSAQGQELAPRIEGVASAEMIGAILDERLALARQKLLATK